MGLFDFLEFSVWEFERLMNDSYEMKQKLNVLENKLRHLYKIYGVEKSDEIETIKVYGNLTKVIDFINDGQTLVIHDKENDTDKTYAIHTSSYLHGADCDENWNIFKTEFIDGNVPIYEDYKLVPYSGSEYCYDGYNFNHVINTDSIDEGYKSRYKKVYQIRHGLLLWDNPELYEKYMKELEEEAYKGE